MGIVEKIIRYMGGFLVSILIVALMLKVFSDIFWAIAIGTLFNGGACYFLLKKYPHDESLKKVVYGAIVGILFIIIVALSLWAFIEAAFQGIAD